MKLFDHIRKMFSKDEAPSQSTQDEGVGEELHIFDLRTKSGFTNARNYVFGIDNPRFVALQILALSDSPYASLIFERAILVMAKLDSDKARRCYKEFKFPEAFDSESFMSSLEAFIDVVGWVDEDLPSEHQKALLYRAWKSLQKLEKVKFQRPFDDLDGKNRILSFGSPGLFPFTYSELKRQFQLEKRWFVAGRYMLFSFGSECDGRPKFFTVLSITGNDLFVLNCFSTEREPMAHRDMLNDIFENLSPDGFKKVSDYMVHHGRKFSVSESEKAAIIDSAAEIFDVARNDLTENQTVYGKGATVDSLKENQALQLGSRF